MEVGCQVKADFQNTLRMKVSDTAYKSAAANLLEVLHERNSGALMFTREKYDDPAYG